METLREETREIAEILNEAQNKLDALIKRTKGGDFSYDERSNLGFARGNLQRARTCLYRIL